MIHLRSPAASPRVSRSHWSRHLRLTVAVLGAGWAVSIRAEVQIERLTLPHGAGPSSFAIGLPNGVNFCFDPIRCSVSYVWTGDFLDVTPTRPGAGKLMAPARLLGPVVYLESGEAPLRRRNPTARPDVIFLGYTLHPEAVEFRYSVDGILVRENVRAASDGRMLVRRLQIEGEPESRWWRVLDGAPPVEVRRDAAGVALITLPLSSDSR